MQYCKDLLFDEINDKSIYTLGELFHFKNTEFFISCYHLLTILDWKREKEDIDKIIPAMVKFI